MTNIMQIKIVEIKYILLWYIIWKKESKKRIEKVKERERERERERENERNNFSFFSRDALTWGVRSLL